MHSKMLLLGCHRLGKVFLLKFFINHPSLKISLIYVILMMTKNTAFHGEQ